MFFENLKNVIINDEFWTKRMDLIHDQSIPYQWEVLNDRVKDVPPSHAIENFRIAAGLASGEFYGYIFQDSDVYKWLEAVAYSLTLKKNEELEKTADEVIELIGQAQLEDGYINTHFSIKFIEKRWTNVRDAHEMYCAGHMFEAAVAYYYATGKTRFIEISCRFADHIDEVFGPLAHQLHGYPGHQEIELALVKLYEVTKEVRYLNLAKYFLDERGQTPLFFDLESDKRGDDLSKRHFGDYNDEYRQSHLPVREQVVATGHAVRAVYMYTAMADVAKESNDDSLLKACQTLWHNMTQTQMYITGSIGSDDRAESFSFDYDLPNDEVYGETCAAIGLMFFAERMLRLEKKSNYADILEKALYNGVLSGVSLDGKGYFYANPLEVYPAAAKFREDKKHIDTIRPGWFGCACCPTNLARLILSLPAYIYQQTNDALYVNLYVGNDSHFKINDTNLNVHLTSSYVESGHVTLTVEADHSNEVKIALRNPAWSHQTEVFVDGHKIDSLTIENGYIVLTQNFEGKHEIAMQFDMTEQLLITNHKVRENAGRVAITRGPQVYCFEEIDNGAILQDIKLKTDVSLEAQYCEDLLEGVTILKGKGLRTKQLAGDVLYATLEQEAVEEVDVVAVPYYAWNNRGEGEMLVWIRK